MPYQRPTNRRALSASEKRELLCEYVQHYRELAATDTTVLNQKISRDAFADVLDRIGEMLVAESEKIVEAEGPVRQFLDANPLPSAMADRLPDQFRVFCLALNALKQWVGAEQGATDRYLLGGQSRELCRKAVETCLISGGILGRDAELHHPVRDGRPPILLSKKGHAALEGQVAAIADDSIGRAILPLRSKTNRSWAQLRRGCLDLLGQPVLWPSKASAAGARAFARQAAVVAGISYEDILNWMNDRDL